MNSEQALERNVLRIADGFPYFIPNVVGIIAITSSDKKQRIGDKQAHTLVARR